MALAIRSENLSKAYQLGEIGTGTLSNDLARWFAKVRGKEDPFLKIGETNDRTLKGKSDIVWSLKDINFEIKEGDAVGIIGRNGAGKSTLLKLLSRVTSPTTGNFKVKGRIASLLEVGTGFHPELTGRENIYLNGAILGMRKKEISRKFDEIVDFSGVERYVDTPVKRYSSGMYVRLAFAVAAHLESEILIVDEVLAVGDAEFQKKCLGKMGEVSIGEGRTVLFVSHNMNSILDLCKSSILLKNGELVDIGVTSKIISKYVSYSSSSKVFISKKDDHKDIQLIKAEVDDTFHDYIDVKLEILSSVTKNCSIDFRITDHISSPVGYASLGALDYSEKVNMHTGSNLVTVRLLIHHLALGKYNIHIDLTNPNIEYYDRKDSCLEFEVIKSSNNTERRYMAQEWNYGSYSIPIELIHIK